MSQPTSKPLIWAGSSRDDLRAFPDDARRAAGFGLRSVQMGLAPDDWKPMPDIGPGVNEIRVKTRLEHRVIYVAKFAEGVYVLHAFEKRARKTPRSDLALARERLQRILAERLG